MIHDYFLELCYLSIALFLTSNLWFFFRVLRPIRQLAVQAESLTEGNFNSFERQCGGIPEIQQLQRAMSGMVGHVRRAQEQSRAYAEQLSEGQENERKRVARELHDDTVQSIIAMTQGIDMAKQWVKTDTERALQMLGFVREQGVEIVNGLRNLIGDLRPPALEELGLIPALEMQFSAINTVEVKLTTQGDARRLHEHHELTLFRVVQEALRNIQRHAQAQHIHLDVDYQEQSVSLRIQDDGVGFEPPQQLGDLAFERHYGLLGIQERVTSLDGQFKLDSQIGKGTTLTIYLPTSPQKQPDNRVRDPVCSALIEPHQAYGNCEYGQVTYYFCCPVCQGAFQKDPDLYISGKIVAMP